jgi:hypothetical protein
MNLIAYGDSTDQTCANEALAPGDSFVSMFFEGRNQFASAFDVEQHATHVRYGPDGRVDIAATCSNTTTRRHLLPQLVASKRKKSEIYMESPSRNYIHDPGILLSCRGRIVSE